jgi:hypothetical protein
MTGKITPESAAHFDGLAAKASERSKATLERLREACDRLVSKGAQLSLKAIEREIQARHGKDAGPKAQSLANASGAELRRYVNLREAERAAAEGNAGKAPKALGALLKSAAADPLLVSKVLDLESELQRTRDELKRAKALLSSGIPGFSPIGSGEQSQGVPSAPPKCLSELAALLSNHERLSAAGLARDPNGRIRRKGGTEDEFMPPRLVTELERLAGTSDGHSQVIDPAPRKK